jgi:hypothetical protein
LSSESAARNSNWCLVDRGFASGEFVRVLLGVGSWEEVGRGGRRRAVVGGGRRWQPQDGVAGGSLVVIAWVWSGRSGSAVARVRRRSLLGAILLLYNYRATKSDLRLFASVL